MNSARKQIISLLRECEVKIEKFFNRKREPDQVINDFEKFIFNGGVPSERGRDILWQHLLKYYCFFVSELVSNLIAILVYIEYLRKGYVTSEFISFVKNRLQYQKEILYSEIIKFSYKEININNDMEDIFSTKYLEHMKEVQDLVNNTLVEYKDEKRYVIGVHKEQNELWSINNKIYDNIPSLIKKIINKIIETDEIKDPIEEFSAIREYVGIAFGKNRVEYIISFDIDKLKLVIEFIKSLIPEEIDYKALEFANSLKDINMKRISLDDYKEYSQVILFEINKRQTMNIDLYPRMLREKIEEADKVIEQRIKDRFGPVKWFVPYWYGFRPNYLNEVLNWLIELEESERATEEELNELLDKWQIKGDYEEKKKEVVNQRKIIDGDVTLRMPCTSSIDIDMNQESWDKIFMTPTGLIRNTQKTDMRQNEVIIETGEVSESETNTNEEEEQEEEEEIEYDDDDYNIVTVSGSSE